MRVSNREGVAAGRRARPIRYFCDAIDFNLAKEGNARLIFRKRCSEEEDSPAEGKVAVNATKGARVFETGNKTKRAYVLT